MTAITALFSGPYDEALALTVEARNYVAYRSDVDQRPLSPGVRLQASFESLRMTTRLTQIMAWLLAEKAMHAGEITLAQLASEQFALGGESICNDGSAEGDEALPHRLRQLLARSRALYQRVSRLDGEVRRSVGIEVDGNDAIGDSSVDDGSAPSLTAAADFAAHVGTSTVNTPVVALRRPMPAR